MKLNFTNGKTLLLSVAMAFGVVSLNAQIFSEDFETGGMAGQGWTTQQGASATGAGWGLASADPTTPAGNFGAECVISRSWLSNVAIQADNYLISPKIDLSAVMAGPITLTYYWANSANGWQDDHDVYIMTTAPVDVATITANAVAINNVTGSGTDTYVKEEIDLSAYIGSDSVYILFHHTSYDNEFITIDDISIAEPSPYDLNTQNFVVDDGGFELFGYYPYFLVPDFNYALTVSNDGTEDISGFVMSGQVSGFQGTFGHTETGMLNAGDTLTVRGEMSLSAPLPDENYTVNITVDIDSTDGVVANNNIDAQLVVSTSEDWYTRFDTAIFNPMTEIPTAPDVFADQFYQYIADRFLNMTSLLGGPGGEQINKVLYGAAFGFTGRTNVSTVEVMIAPKAVGQETWVEVYNYDNALNTIDDPVEPVFVSDTFTVPAGFDDNVPHLMEYTFDPGTLVLETGKYIVCVVEKANTDVDGLGMMAYRNDDGWSENNTSFFNYEYINTADNFPTMLGFRNSNVFYVYSSSQLPINSSFPIGLRVQNVVGVAENVDASAMINVYPNPAQNEFNITVSGSDFRPTSVAVKDLAGRTVKTINGTLGRKVITVNAADLESGVYFVELFDGQQKAVKKVVLK